jgi:hypothetical protein
MRLAALTLAVAIAGIRTIPAAAQSADNLAADRHLAIRAARLVDGRGGPPLQNAVIHSPIDYAVAAPIFARGTLEAGFTTVRDVGAAEFIDVALRQAIDSGLVAGPRMQVATLTVGATGGHGDVAVP